MKKLLLALLILTICVFAGACSPFMMGRGSCIGLPNGNNNNTTYDDSFYQDETTYQEETTSDDTYYNSISGTYTCEDTVNYSAGYYPYLELFADGTFYLYVNLGEGMGTIEGTYSESGDYVDLYVTYRDFTGYLGADYETITFFIIDDYTLELYSDDIGVTYSGEFFTKN